MSKIDPNGWMLESYNGYLVFPRQDDSQIAVSIWNHPIPVALHRHAYYEFALITKGCCIHQYRQSRVPLIPGDVFMIEPHEEHGYDLQTPIELINCQFFHECLGDECSLTLKQTQIPAISSHDQEILKKRWNEVVHYIPRLDIQKESWNATTQANLNKQGVIHLNITERREIEYIFQQIMNEQHEQNDGFAFMKSAYLQQIFVIFQRIQKKRMKQVSHHTDRRREYIFEVLEYMENHLTEKLDWQHLAEGAYWSAGYFRSVFKDITGLTPVDYLNRLRIVKSIEYAKQEHLNFQEAAARVGIYDASYYNRLFKKVIGDSPREFRKKRW